MSTLKELQPNVGFLLRELPGFSRDLEIELSQPFHLGPDMELLGLKGALNLSRTQQGIWIMGKLQGSRSVECARCLQPFVQTLRVKLEEMFFHPPSKAIDPADYVVKDDGRLDLVEPLREQLSLVIPLRSLCRPDCKGLCSNCGQDLNEGSCNCTDDEIDPRFASLLQFKTRFKDSE